MKKHDEGYALVLVLVVLAVLSLVVASVLSVSLKNLQSQQSSIERMQDKYMAQGKMEIVEAQLSDALTGQANKRFNSFDGSETLLGAKDTIEIAICNAAKVQKIAENGSLITDNIAQISEIKWIAAETDNKFSATITVRVSYDEESELVCVITLADVIRKGTSNGSEYYEIAASPITYDSYTITTETDGGEPQ